MTGATRPGLAARLSRFLVGCHPRRWRERYREEVLDVLDQHRPTARTALGMGASAVSARLDPAWRGRAARSGRRWYAGPVGLIVAPLLSLLIVVAGCAGVAAWRDVQANNGPPMPLSDGTFGMVFSPDGQTVAAINPNLELWSVADPAHPVRLGYSKGDTAGAPAAFSPDGQVLATAGWPGLLWDVAHPTPRPAQLPFLPDYPGTVNALLFFPDGRTLVSGDANGTLTLWDTADPARPAHIATIAGSGAAADGVSALAFSPVAPVLASGDDGGAVTLWNAADPARLIRVTSASGTGQAGVSALAFSPNGRLLASASDDGTVVLRDIASPAAPAILTVLRCASPAEFASPSRQSSDVEIAFSADGRTLTAIAGNTTVTRWNVTDPRAVTRIATYTSDSLGSGAVAFGPGGRVVAGPPTVGDTLRVWSLP